MVEIFLNMVAYSQEVAPRHFRPKLILDHVSRFLKNLVANFISRMLDGL